MSPELQAGDQGQQHGSGKNGLNLTCPVPGLFQARPESQSESLNGAAGVRWSLRESTGLAQFIGWWQKPKCCSDQGLGHSRRGREGPQPA